MGTVDAARGPSGNEASTTSAIPQRSSVRRSRLTTHQHSNQSESTMNDSPTANGHIPEITEPIEFTQDELARIEKLKALYPSTKSAIMPVLWMAQKKWGWLSTEVMKKVGEVLDLPYSHVYGVASFYTMYFKKPMGRHHIQVCTNVSCLLRGGETLYRHVSGKFGIGHNERTTDGRFSLEEVECMGACGGAPMIAVNEEYFENVTVEELDRLIGSLG
jgi:NADH-quinone oxidoreductase E subunit